MGFEGVIFIWRPIMHTMRYAKRVRKWCCGPLPMGMPTSLIALFHCLRCNLMQYFTGKMGQMSAVLTQGILISMFLVSARSFCD